MSGGSFDAGNMAESMQAQSKGGPSPEIFGWFFVAAGLAFFLLGQALSISLIVSGRYLKQRKNYLSSFILACLACAASLSARSSESLRLSCSRGLR